MKTLLAWLTDINRRFGYRAALVTLVVLVCAAVGVIVATGIEPADFVRWLASVG